MLTDTIPTPGWWLCGLRTAVPMTRGMLTCVLMSDGRQRVDVDGHEVHGYTHDPEAVLAWVHDGALP